MSTQSKSFAWLAREDVFLILMLVFGCLMRVLWPGDMEWKGDEQYNYHVAAVSVQNGTWAQVGILNSQGIPNPPISSWIFKLFAWMTHSPIGLVQCIQWLNVLGVLLFVWGLLKIYHKEGTLLILRGMTLFSVSPMPIIYSRKIWQQCLLPPLSVSLILPFVFPKSVWAFVVAGLFSCLGVQIHQSGLFFYPIVFMGFAWHFRAQLRWMQWIGFGLGALLGLVPLWPWIQNVARDGVALYPSSRVFELSFIEYFLRDGFGLGLNYLLQGYAWSKFLEFPFISGQPTYLVQGVIWLSVILLGTTGLFAVAKINKARHTNRASGILCISFILYGALLLALGIRTFPHYLIVLYPLLHILVVRLIGRRRWLAHLLILTSALISFLFLSFIHSTGGFDGTEYGRTYRTQISK